MDFHTRKRIEIILEAPALHRLTEMLDRLDVTGYTIVPALAGKGQHGSWSREGMPSDVGRMVMIVVVTRAERVPDVLEPIFALVKRHMGIVTVSDVQVLRPEHF